MIQLGNEIYRNLEIKMTERLVTGEEMKQLDTHTIEYHGVPSLVLMERAALTSVEVLYDEGFDLTRVGVFCGAGNNGGDGFAIARLLHLANVDTKLVFVGQTNRRSPETKTQQEIAESYGLAALNLYDIHDIHGKKTQEISSGVNNYINTEFSTVIDAIFGIGSLRAPEGIYLDAIKNINQKRKSGSKVLSIDIPSGVSADTGETPGEAVRADVTVTFAYKKVGLTLPPGSALAGKIIVKDIGIY
jgi:NAD(P)H-hydrate epimerase